MPETLSAMALPPNTGLPLRIYLVEDDNDLREEVVYSLAEMGFDAHGFPDAGAFYRAFAAKPCHIAVLDIGLPGEDGLSMAAHLRAGSVVGIVMLTARGAMQDRLLGLRSGADAYLVKPVDLGELAATLQSLGRRLAMARTGVPAAVPAAPRGWSLAGDGWMLREPGGRELALTANERAFLGCLLEQPGQAVSRDQLIVALGGDVYDFDAHRIDAMASRLRRKAADAGLQLPLRAVRGTGYVFVPANQAKNQNPPSA